MTNLNKLKYVLLFMVLVCYGCDTKQRITGNYFTCYHNLYGELYFEKDSFRMADGLEYFSHKEKYQIMNDSLYHMTFGEMRDSSKAKIEFLNKNEFILYYPEDSMCFKKLEQKINLNLSYEDFWNAFRERKKERNCVQ